MTVTGAVGTRRWVLAASPPVGCPPDNGNINESGNRSGDQHLGIFLVILFLLRIYVSLVSFSVSDSLIFVCLCEDGSEKSG